MYGLSVKRGKEALHGQSGVADGGVVAIFSLSEDVEDYIGEYEEGKVYR